jgi:hypothetical protein
MGEQAYWLVASRDGFLHELPEGSGQTRCGRWAERDLKPATSETRFCPAGSKATAAPAVQGSLDFGEPV